MQKLRLDKKKKKREKPTRLKAHKGSLSKS